LLFVASEGCPFLAGQSGEIAQKQCGLSQEDLQLVARDIADVVCRALIVVSPQFTNPSLI
jgi:hypothetical protein